MTVNATDFGRKVVLSGLGIAGLVYSTQLHAACISSLIQVTALTTPLDFGTFECSAGTGSVTVKHNNGNVRSTGCVSTVSGSPGRAVVRVIGGQARRKDKVRITFSATSVSIVNGGSIMSVTSIKAKPAITRTIGGDRTKTFYIGGTVNTTAAKTDGTYTGTVTVRASCL